MTTAERRVETVVKPKQTWRMKPASESDGVTSERGWRWNCGRRWNSRMKVINLRGTSSKRHKQFRVPACLSCHQKQGWKNCSDLFTEFYTCRQSSRSWFQILYINLYVFVIKIYPVSHLTKYLFGPWTEIILDFWEGNHSLVEFLMCHGRLCVCFVGLWDPVRCHRHIPATIPDLKRSGDITWRTLGGTLRMFWKHLEDHYC